MDTEAARVHHRVRREWMARLRQLESDYRQLSARGEAVVWLPEHKQRPTRAGWRNRQAASFGLRMLFEIEAFRPEDLDSAADARELVEECAGISFADCLPRLEKSRDSRRHPEWLPELREALVEERRFTLELLESTEDGPVPPYRWRLPTRVHEQAWEEFNRAPSWSSGRSSYEYADLLDELRAREIQRVHLVHHPLYGYLSCETDTSLLVGGGQDWMETEGCYLTSASLEWWVQVGMYGEWDARGW